jgi:hypothetical protein
MALLMQEPHEQAAHAVVSAFRSFNDSKSFRSPALRNATGKLELTDPHQVFTLGLAELVAGKGLEAATPSGWRYLVREDHNVLASAEAVRGAKGEDYAFASFNEGGFVAATAHAIQAAHVLPVVSQGAFELRLLNVPGLYVMALWLHQPNGTGDLLIPLAPSPVDVPTGEAVPAARLLAELAAKAESAAAVGHDDRTGG